MKPGSHTSVYREIAESEVQDRIRGIFFHCASISPFDSEGAILYVKIVHFIMIKKHHGNIGPCQLRISYDMDLSEGVRNLV